MSHKDEETQKTRLRRILYIWGIWGVPNCGRPGKGVETRMLKSDRVRNDSRVARCVGHPPQVVRVYKYSSGKTDSVRDQGPPC